VTLNYISRTYLIIIKLYKKSGGRLKRRKEWVSDSLKKEKVGFGLLRKEEH